MMTSFVAALQRTIKAEVILGHPLQNRCRAAERHETDEATSTLTNTGTWTKPVKIVMPKVNYDLLEDYRRKLPLLADGVPDYFTQYALFGLPIYIDNSLDCEVMVV